MTRAQLEHIIRAASAVSGESDLVIIGSQAILGSFPDAPPSMTLSNEADIYPRERPDLTTQISGAIGEYSMFHETNGYYAHGVGPETAKPPRGWEARLVPVCDENTNGATGWCLEAHDLILSKLAVGRDRDIQFANEAIRVGIADPRELRSRVAEMPVREDLKEFIRSLLPDAANTSGGTAPSPLPRTGGDRWVRPHTRAGRTVRGYYRGR